MSTECHSNTTIGHFLDKHNNDKTIFNQYNLYLDTMVNFDNITSVDSYYLHGILLRTLYLNESIVSYSKRVNTNTLMKINLIDNNMGNPYINIHLHSKPYSQIDIVRIFSDDKFVGFNQTLIIKKTIVTYLPAPHGNCSSYSGTTGEQPFGSQSHTQCVRRCVGYYWRQRHKCYPIFIDHNLHELDYKSNDIQSYCYYKNSNLYYNISVECLKYCPKDCLTVEYNSRVISSDSQIGTEFWYNLSVDQMSVKKSLVWDSTQPLYVYREEPVMSLTDYMSYTGGLFSLWFGTNGKHFTLWLIDTIHVISIWFSHKYIQYFSNNRVYDISN